MHDIPPISVGPSVWHRFSLLQRLWPWVIVPPTGRYDDINAAAIQVMDGGWGGGGVQENTHTLPEHYHYVCYIIF